MTTKARPEARTTLESKEKLLSTLKAKAGKATLGDLIVGSGLPKGETEAALKELLGEYESHLAVDDKGEILYLFAPSFLRRGDKERAARAWRKTKAMLWRGFVAFFKVAIMLVLVVYFAIFVALIIAAIVAMLSAN